MEDPHRLVLLAKSELTRVRKLLKDANAKNEDLEGQLENAAAEADHHSGAARKAQTAAARATSAQTHLEKQIQSLRDELQFEQGNNRNIIAERDDLASQLAEHHTNWAATFPGATTQNVADGLFNLITKTNDLEVQNDALTKALNATKLDLNATEARLSTSSLDVDAFRQEIAALKVERDLSEDKAQKAAVNEVTAFAQAQEAELELGILRGKLENTLENSARYRKATESHRASVKSSWNRITTLAASTHATELARLQRTLNETEVDLATTTAQAKALRMSVGLKETDLVIARKSLDVMDRAYHRTRAELIVANDELACARGVVAALHRRADASEANVVEKDLAIAALQARLAPPQAPRSALTTRQRIAFPRGRIISSTNHNDAFSRAHRVVGYTGKAATALSPSSSTAVGQELAVAPIESSMVDRIVEGEESKVVEEMGQHQIATASESPAVEITISTLPTTTTAAHFIDHSATGTTKNAKEKDEDTCDSQEEHLQAFSEGDVCQCKHTEEPSLETDKAKSTPERASLCSTPTLSDSSSSPPASPTPEDENIIHLSTNLPEFTTSQSLVLDVTGYGLGLFGPDQDFSFERILPDDLTKATMTPRDDVETVPLEPSFGQTNLQQRAADTPQAPLDSTLSDNAPSTTGKRRIMRSDVELARKRFQERGSLGHLVPPDLSWLMDEPRVDVSGNWGTAPSISQVLRHSSTTTSLPKDVACDTSGLCCPSQELSGPAIIPRDSSTGSTDPQVIVINFTSQNTAEPVLSASSPPAPATSPTSTPLLFAIDTETRASGSGRDPSSRLDATESDGVALAIPTADAKSDAAEISVMDNDNSLVRLRMPANGPTLLQEEPLHDVSGTWVAVLDAKLSDNALSTTGKRRIAKRDVALSRKRLQDRGSLGHLVLSLLRDEQGVDVSGDWDTTLSISQVLPQSFATTSLPMDAICNTSGSHHIPELSGPVDGPRDSFAEATHPQVNVTNFTSQETAGPVLLVSSSLVPATSPTPTPLPDTETGVSSPGHNHSSQPDATESDGVFLAIPTADAESDVAEISMMDHNNSLMRLREPGNGATLLQEEALHDVSGTWAAILDSSLSDCAPSTTSKRRITKANVELSRQRLRARGSLGHLVPPDLSWLMDEEADEVSAEWGTSPGVLDDFDTSLVPPQPPHHLLDRFNFWDFTRYTPLIPSIVEEDLSSSAPPSEENSTRRCPPGFTLLSTSPEARKEKASANVIEEPSRTVDVSMLTGGNKSPLVLADTTLKAVAGHGTAASTDTRECHEKSRPQASGESLKWSTDKSDWIELLNLSIRKELPSSSDDLLDDATTSDHDAKNKSFEAWLGVAV